MSVTYASLEHISAQARIYPTPALKGCETGLVLFAAAFLGHNDAIHFAEAGLETTCVDVDAARLAQMAELYPAEWEFVATDAWDFAATADEQWDAVSVDTFSGDAMYRSLASLDLWCSLARKMVTVTITSEATGSYRTPEGWSASLFTRGPGVYWLVLERA